MHPLVVRLLTPQTRTGYLVVAASIAISYAIWLGSMWHYGDHYENAWHYPAKAGSHGATLLMCWAFILSTRARPVERLFGGLDEVYQAHRYIGEAAMFLILLHPVFLATDRLPGVGSYLSFFLFSDDWVRNTGIAALLGLILLVVFAVYSRVRYHLWKQTHHFFGLLFLLAMTHAVIARGEIVKYPLLTAWFAGWSLAAVAAFVYIRLLYRWIGPELDYQVVKIENKADEVTELHLRPCGRGLIHREGQFAYLRLVTDRISGEPHPFSIASAPDEEILRLSIKRIGDWTRRVDDIHVGTEARISGPYGRFALDIFDCPDRDAVLIGGGIGITPFLSVVRSPALPKRSGKLWMIYSATNEESAIYGEEMDARARRVPNLQFIRHLSDTDGYLTREYLEERVGKLEGKMFFICGPAPMMDAVRQALVDAGVPLEDIAVEDFNVR